MISATQPLRTDAQVIGLVGLGHGTSHFFHLLLAPLFPWLKDAFGLSYAELGLLMTVFFIVSGVGQALAGFVVDRIGALPILLGGLALLCISALGLATSNSYAALMLFAAVAGVGNSVFHPADFTVLNRRVSTPRLGHAFSVHGLSGALGWAAAPVFLAGIASLTNWRIALLAAAVLAFVVLAVLFVFRDLLDPGETSDSVVRSRRGGAIGDSLQFLTLRAVWMCFAFFLVASLSFGGIQSFAPAAIRDLYSLPFTFATACITAYMLASAGGLVIGGFAAARTQYHDRVIAVAFTIAGSAALLVALGSMPGWMTMPMLAVVGFGAGLAGPSRDLLVRAAAPSNATGRVYGVVYSGMDIGLAIAPPIFGALMDTSHPAWVFVLMGLFQFAAMLTAVGVGERTVRSAQPA
ncbi:MAG: MFS transporter [Betaproteobacteria bacterium]|nr:MAG: MFS transporter [Betaproteobacteria bacterium]